MENIPIRNINASQEKLKLADNFSIRNLRDLFEGKDMVQKLHKHSFFYVLVLKKGKGDHQIDFTPYTIDDHSIFFMRPGQVHQLNLKLGSAGFLMAFTTDFYRDKESNQYLRKASNTNFYQFDQYSFNKIYSVFQYMFQEYTDKNKGYEEVIKSNLNILFIELNRLQHENPLSDGVSYTQQRLEDFLELLNSHIFSHKQVSYYADMLNLSPYQLNAITKTSLGKTCSELINGYIILESKRYLLATSNQVTQIAYHLGYQDVSYFIRFFKRQTGFSPEVFRQNFK
ncbi:AraC family transcriptional regulator [Aquimarina sediminis]|uniref:AraC family transcriptional regulator n=1 Tax=Aquimarina sediminis TaxID=2070536 RepID=UPI000C9FFFE2|nr:AraC family transcriptional regulator [Aquimarina sediminis]